MSFHLRMNISNSRLNSEMYFLRDDKEKSMAHETLNDLLLEELQDIYDAEHQITKALPKMMEAASSKDLKKAFQLHLEQTEGQITRLEEIFEIMGEEAERKPCKAMKGLIAEGEDMIKDHDASVLLDAGLIGSAQRVEHYEMAAYGTSRAYAEALGEQEIVELLQQTLDEEKQTDQALTELSVPINQKSAQETASSRNGNTKKSGKGAKSGSHKEKSK